MTPEAKPLGSRLLSGAAWAFSARLLFTLFGFIVNALLARLLAPDDMGAYFLIFSVATFFTLFAQMGMKQAVVKLVAEALGNGREGRARGIIRVVLLAGFLSGVVAALLYYSLLGAWVSDVVFDSESMAMVLGVTSLWIIPLTLQHLISESFRGLHDIRYASIFQGTTTSFLTAIFITTWWVLYSEATLLQAVAMSVIASTITVVVAGALLLGKLRSLRVDSEPLDFRSMSGTAGPLFVSSVILFLTQEGHIWLLGAIQDEQQVALYGATARLIGLVALPLLMINRVIMPMVADLFATDKLGELERMLRAAATVAGIPGLILIIFFLFFGKGFLGLVFGPYYEAGYAVLVFLAVGKGTDVLTGSPGVVLMMTGRQWVYLRCSMVAGPIGIAVSYSLAGRYGAVGVAIGSSLATVLLNLMMWAYCVRVIGIKTHMGFSAAKDISVTLKRLVSRRGGV